MRELGPLAAESRLARCGDNFRRRLDNRGQKIVMVVLWIVGLVRKPYAIEEIRLPGHGAILHLHAVEKAVLNMRIAPIPAPDQPAALGELPQKSEIALPNEGSPFTTRTMSQAKPNGELQLREVLWHPGQTAPPGQSGAGELLFILLKRCFRHVQDFVCNFGPSCIISSS